MRLGSTAQRHGVQGVLAACEALPGTAQGLAHPAGPTPPRLEDSHGGTERMSLQATGGLSPAGSSCQDLASRTEKQWLSTPGSC